MDAAQTETQAADGEHEATDVVEASSEPEPAPTVEEGKPAGNGVADEKDGVDAEPPAPAPEDASKEEAKQPTPATSPPATPKKITARSSIAVKPPAGKAATGPPTPLVKKVR